MKILKAFLPGLLIIVVVGAICGAFLVHRGFRATATPLPFEAALARRVRSLAIPSDEIRRKNPFEASSETTFQGREYFLNQCAACHGIDGGGKTQIGLNLYPRVPDLRLPATQDLTDGEIHYVIENGVQLTGMPAWGNPDVESSGTSWKLVLFIRSLRAPTDEDRRQRATTAESAHYVGSPACERCHAKIYERW